MIDNPYKVLGLKEDAGDDEVKAAYKTLAKQYHPDLNSSPYAEARMKEINEAYTQIMKGGRAQPGSAYSSQNRSSYYGSGPAESAKMTAVRNYINSGHFREALNVLDAIPDRTARWYYYAAIAHSGLGNRMEALENAQHACQMDPSNFEYQRLLEQLQYGTAQYQQFGRGFQMPTMDVGRLCMSLCAARLFCSFCGCPC
ncbi:MAG: DnaJ domain-containing protein [Clostridia bacterium]